jgi:DNA polymerase-3 subunit gamma/tau
VFIIDEVHDLSGKAFDALLKTIEEPPAHLVFILATTEYTKVPATIRSRCQKYEFYRGSVSDLVRRLEQVAKAEGAEIEPAALAAIARMADGAYRDALNLLEQAMVTSDGPITLDQVYDQLGLVHEEEIDALLLALRQCNVAQIQESLELMTRAGRDPRVIVESALYRLADLTTAILGAQKDRGSDAPQSASLHEAATRLGSNAILGLRSAFAQAHLAIRDVTLPRLWLEAELIRIAMNLQELPAVESKPGRAPAKREPAPAVESPAAATAEEQKEPPAATSAEPAQLEAKPDLKPDAKVAEPELPHDAPPEVRKAAQVWRDSVRAISETKSKVMSRLLLGTQVTSFDSGKVTIEFERQIDHDKFVDGPNGPARVAHVLEVVQEVAAEPWQIEYVVAKRVSNGAPTAAVEFPLEGQELLEAVKEIFPGNS